VFWQAETVKRFDSLSDNAEAKPMKIRCIVLLAFTALAASSLPTPTWAQSFVEDKQRDLIADGPSYELIKKAFGEKAIESPGLYPSNHPGTPHIFEAEDDVVGPYFIFLSHRDEDKDRDKDYTDRQRNEIKAYDRSRSSLKGFEGETMQYQLIFQAKNIETGEVLVDFQEDNIDMWRGEHKSDFSRPKWGIYRSLKDKESLRSEEERARFADFSIRKGSIK